MMGTAQARLCPPYDRPSSNPDVILGGAAAALMTRVEHPARLDQQQLDLVFGIRLVFDAFRDDEHLARRYADCTVAKIDPEDAPAR
jgi:hypothetical protein